MLGTRKPGILDWRGPTPVNRKNLNHRGHPSTALRAGSGARCKPYCSLAYSAFGPLPRETGARGCVYTGVILVCCRLWEQGWALFLKRLCSIREKTRWSRCQLLRRPHKPAPTELPIPQKAFDRKDREEERDCLQAAEIPSRCRRGRIELRSMNSRGWLSPHEHLRALLHLKTQVGKAVGAFDLNYYGIAGLQA
jgi:hypothetical protein